LPKRSRGAWTPLETGPPAEAGSFFRARALPDIDPPRAPRSFALIRWTVGAFALGVPLAVMLLASVLVVPPAIGRAWSNASAGTELPEPKELPGSTYVYDRDARVVTKLHGEIDRTPIPLKQIPKHLRNAVIAVEGEDFYTEGGVNLRSILRAAYTNLLSGEVEEGGSTITQQYVKKIYTDGSRTLSRKIQEALIAEKLSREMTKNEILERYLNAVYFGQGAYGVQAAAKTFFGIPAKKLSLIQSATLAGLIAAPARFDPVLSPEAGLHRRNYVLDRMVAERYLTVAEAAALKAEPLAVLARKPTASLSPYFSDHVRRYLQDKYGVERTFGGGLRVHTTIDMAWQRAAEAAVAGRLGLPGDPAAALVAIDPRNGAIRAMVGGTNFSKKKFNLATQAHRQTGSAFKTFALVAALERGISPKSVWNGPGAMKIDDPRCRTNGGPWEVHNYSESGAGTMPLFSAFARSVNTIFAQVAVTVGPPNIAEVANRMGIDTPLSPVCSITLGANAVTPLEMTEAFATIASGGIHREPVPVQRVLGPTGTVLEQFRDRGERVLSANVAAATTMAMEGVVTGGTGGAAYIGRPVAGKTGTGQNYQDAWFCGFVPQLVTCVWVGYPAGEIPMHYVHGLYGVTGGSIPAGIWHDFMEVAMADEPVEYFPYADLSRFTVIPKVARPEPVEGDKPGDAKPDPPSTGGGGGGGGDDGEDDEPRCYKHRKPRCHGRG
jgi:penicillin-binding protein 1A